MSYQKPPFMFKIIKGFLNLVYPKTEICGLETLTQPSVLVGNHCQIHGPLIAELRFPENRLIWCAGAMMHLKTVPPYAYQDFWSQKPRISRPFYKLLSYLIAPLAALLFQNAHTIGVYRDGRLISTFRETINALNNQNHVVIFPEHDRKYNHIVYEFEENFVDVARLYYKRTGVALPFVPMYLSPRLKKVQLGQPIFFDPNAPIEEERRRISNALMSAVTTLAEEMPLHTVVPYRNIPKRHYPKNKESANEKNRR